MALVEGRRGCRQEPFRGRTAESRFIGGYCLPVFATTTQDPYADLVRKAVFLADEQRVIGNGSPSFARLQDFAATEHEPASLVEQEELDRDLVSLLASLARQKTGAGGDRRYRPNWTKAWQDLSMLWCTS